jgi:hypothetical protein
MNTDRQVQSGKQLLFSAIYLFKMAKGDRAMEKRWTADELIYAAKVSAVVERERDRYERKARRPLTDLDLVRFQMWQGRYEEQAWTDFYGPVEPFVIAHRR